MTRQDETGIYFPVNRATDLAIPPVPAERVRAAALNAVEYAERKGLSTDDVVELLSMLRINADTIENGLYASEIFGGAA